MALLWIDGFEKYGTNGSAINTNNIVEWKYNGNYDERCDIVTGRNGNALQIDSTAINIITPAIKTPGSTDNILIVGFAFQFNTLVATCSIVEFRDPTDHGETIGWRQFALTVNSTGNGSEIDVIRGKTTIDTSTTANLQAGQWYYLEMKVYCHDTNGTCNVQLDGTEIISFSGDTRHRTYNSAPTYDKVMWRVSTGSTALWIDDLYICDGYGSSNNDFLGDCEVATLSPSSDVTTEWTQDFGSNLYDRIYEDQQNTGYISEDTSGNQALFELDNLTANQAAKTVKGVMLCCDSNQTQQGMVQYAKAITQNSSSGAVQYTGNFMPGTTNSLCNTLIMEDDPDGNAWTAATVNSLRMGVELS